MCLIYSPVLESFADRPQLYVILPVLRPLGRNCTSEAKREAIGARLFEACKHPPQSFTRIRDLIDSYPGVITHKDVDGRVALHVACGSRVNVQVAEILVNQWNDSVRQVTKKGLTPLHYACRFQASSEVVTYLIDRWTDSVKQTTRSGWLPLHLACARQAPEDVVVFLVQVWPEALRIPTSDGRLPLHFALANSAPLSLVQYLVEKSPCSIQAKDLYGWTPLHVACAYSKFEVVEYCIRQWSSGCKEKGMKGRIPLHIVCWERRPVRYVHYVKQQWQNSIRERDDHGLLPLHAACQGEAPLEVIKYLLEQWPASIWEIGKSECEIVDYTFRSRHADPQTVAEFSQWIQATIGKMSSFDATPQKNRYLVPPHSTGVDLASSSNMRTFEWSEGHGSSANFQMSNDSRDFGAMHNSIYFQRRNGSQQYDDHRISRVVVECVPSQASHQLKSIKCIEVGGQDSPKQEKGHSIEVESAIENLEAMGTSLHKLCEAPQSLPAIQRLLLKCPRAVECLAYNGNLPIHTACLNQAPVAVLKVLIDQYPQSLQKSDQYGNLPLHQACFSGTPLSSIKHLVRRCPDSMLQINQCGERPLDRARNPFFDAKDANVIEWLENPYFDQNDDYDEDTIYLQPPSPPTLDQVTRSDVLSFEDLNCSSQRTVDTQTSDVAVPNLGIKTGGNEISPHIYSLASGSSQKQPARQSFSKPMGIDQTRAAIELLRESKAASKHGLNDVGGKDADVAIAAGGYRPANFARRSWSSAGSSPLPLSRNPSDDDAGIGLATQSSRTHNSNTGIVQVNAPAMQPSSLVHKAVYSNTSDVSAMGRLVESSFYQAALEASLSPTYHGARNGPTINSYIYGSGIQSATPPTLPSSRSPNGRPAPLAPRARSFDDDQTGGFGAFMGGRLHGEPARTSLISAPSSSSGNSSFLEGEPHHGANRRASESSVASRLSRPHSSINHPTLSSLGWNPLKQNASDLLGGQQQLQRPGAIMVHEPAIRPNSALYRAACRLPAQQRTQQRPSPHQDDRPRLGGGY